MTRLSLILLFGLVTFSFGQNVQDLTRSNSSASPQPAPTPLPPLPISDPNDLTTGYKGKYASNYFENVRLPLTPEEQAGLLISSTWRDRCNGQAAPRPGKVNEVIYTFGESWPSIICTPLQITDVALEPGENVLNSPFCGDTIRWKIDVASSGDDEGNQPHLLIKPVDVGLENSLVVTTDRRTYHFNLKSEPASYMPSVAFVYPDTLRKRAEAEAAALAARNKLEHLDSTAAKSEEERPKDFGYKVIGRASWRPIRIWNDGVHTFIQMPSGIQEAPVINLLRGKSGWFSKPEEVLANYRLNGTLYTVDQVISKAVMRTGVGKDAEKILIVHGKTKSIRSNTFILAQQKPSAAKS